MRLRNNGNTCYQNAATLSLRLAVLQLTSLAKAFEDLAATKAC